MSRIGKKHIEIAGEATVELKNDTVVVIGPKGAQTLHLEKGISVKVQDGKVIVEAPNKQKQLTALHGLTRAMLANMITGVTKGFEKTLELVGVGYKAVVSGDELTLSLGFSHPVKIKAPQGITFSVGDPKGSVGVPVTISGVDKQSVGEVAATIRRLKPPEPYKGKGIRYRNERIRKKAGKAAKTLGGTEK